MNNKTRFDIRFRVSGPLDLLDVFASARKVEAGGEPFRVEVEPFSGPPRETEQATVKFHEDMSQADARNRLDYVLGKVAASNDMEAELEKVSVDRIEES